MLWVNIPSLLIWWAASKFADGQWKESRKESRKGFNPPPMGFFWIISDLLAMAKMATGDSMVLRLRNRSCHVANEAYGDDASERVEKEADPE